MKWFPNMKIGVKLVLGFMTARVTGLAGYPCIKSLNTITLALGS